MVPMIFRVLVLLVLGMVVPGGAQTAAADPLERLVDLSGLGEAGAKLRFVVRDPLGQAVACRLTFVVEGGAPRPLLFGAPKAAAREFAARNNVLYTLLGQGLVTVPPGSYTVWASRGLEWSVAQAAVDLRAGETTEAEFRLTHEVQTDGWVSGDCHLHTVTHSGHGDADLNERIISLIGEGVEFGVATDHNHTTDYRPTIQELGVERHLHPVRGNEISVPAGHFNVFPVDHWDTHPYRFARDAQQLFRFVRSKVNAEGIVPVIQLNHPRWRDIDAFGQCGLDPVTGESLDPHWSSDFDTVEVLNENPSWGYWDAERPKGRFMGSGSYWALRDWFHLLNRGLSVAATGNSDSHTVEANFAGFPRNYIASPVATPDELTDAMIAEAFRNGHCFTTSGPFPVVEINGAGPGGTARPDSQGELRASITIRCASWIGCDRVKVVFNGDVIATVKVPPGNGVDRYSGHIPIPVKRDGWVVILVEGDASLAPILRDKDRPVLPIAVVNPVWIDGDGDGTVESPVDMVLRRLAENQSSNDLLPSERALLLVEAGKRNHPAAGALLARAVGATRAEALAAARAARDLRQAELIPSLHALVQELDDDDAHLGALLERALTACGAPDPLGRLAAFRDRFGVGALSRHGEDLTASLPYQDVKEFRVQRGFGADDPVVLADLEFGPPSDPSLKLHHSGVGGGTVPWEILQSDESGYLDLARRDEGGRFLSDGSVAYAGVFLEVQEPQKVLLQVGTDDGGRIWVDGVLRHDDRGSHGARLTQWVELLDLSAGVHRLLIRVQNGGGATGLRARLVGEGVRVLPAGLGNPQEVAAVPLIDLATDPGLPVVVDRQGNQYLGHPTTVLMGDGRTILVAYPKGHGRGPIVLKKSDDGGRTWSESLPVPENFSTSQETPTLHRMSDPSGRERLLLFSGLRPVRLSVSEDEGDTWSPLAPIFSHGGIVAMASVVPLEGGRCAAFFHDDGRFFEADGKAEGKFSVYQTFSADGGRTWSKPETIVSREDVHLCEPGVIRSPDQKSLAMLLRENRRKRSSHVMFSEDQAQSWSLPRELPGTLTGDRHVGQYAPDGRLVISFRDTAAGSRTQGDWVCWVGTFEDLVAGRPGQYRVRLMDNLHEWDCGYAGLEVLPDGTFVGTSYGHWTQGEPPWIATVRFTLDDLDRRLTR